MIVKDLLDILVGVDPKTEIVVASDAEGNEYSSLQHAELCRMIGGARDIEVFEAGTDGEPCIALWRI